jgi:hypothetical protein
MAITPDTKNWTWVLERPCPECGFDASTFDATMTSAAIFDNAQRWAQLLTDHHVTLRPHDGQWSALEYGCHVRDVFRLFDRRLKLMLEQDAPTFDNWDQDATAIDDAYGLQDPAVVSRELNEAAEVLAGRFATVVGDQWSRTGTRSDGAIFDVSTFGTYMIHDPVHHVHDVEQGYKMLG